MDRDSRFNHLDLNLLFALDVLQEEEDELLVQVGRKMQPTPYALELAKPVREVLRPPTI